MTAGAGPSIGISPTPFAPNGPRPWPDSSSTVTTGGAYAQNPTPGVQLNLVLKKGTNTPHGNASIYFENEGLQTELDLANWLATDGSRALGDRPVLPIIIQATADGGPDITPAEVLRFNGPRDDPTKPHLAPAPMQLLAPLAGLNAVRGGHSNVLLRQARDQYGERFFHFFLPGDGGKEVPLNWVLSDGTTAFIRGAIKESKLSGNDKELQRLHDFK